MTDPAKVRRHSERVKELVASAVRNIKDPRLGMITITDTRLTGDLREATVFYTVLGDSAAQAGTAAALESAKGLLRSTVGKALGLRHSPSMIFSPRRSSATRPSRSLRPRPPMLVTPSRTSLMTRTRAKPTRTPRRTAPRAIGERSDLRSTVGGR
jgi:ribosome-binding factor A